MTYLRQTKRKKENKNRLIFLITLFFILLFGFSNVVFPNKLTHAIAYPIIKIKDVVVYPFSNFGSYLKTKKTLIKEKEELLEEIADLKVSNFEAKLVEAENTELREILDRKKEDDAFTFAHVLVKPPQSLYDTLVIDLGEGNISTDQKIYSKGIEIGKVEIVYEKTSIVKLYSSSGTKIQVLINGKNSAEAIGQGGGRFTTVIPKDIEVNEGDVVSINGENKVFGIIQKVESTDANSFQTLFFNTPVNINEINIVEIKK